ncbi:hypothetical protein [Halosimplex sp. J119]
MATNKPPYDATVENIRELCQSCRDTSNAESDDLEEETEDLEGTTFDRNLEAAVILGLFKKDEDGLYTPTKRGKRIGYGPDNGEEEKIFREIVRENEFYNQLLEIVGDKLTEKDGEHYLSRDDVMKQIGINFDFGVGDRTLESASGTFLKVLDAAGLGEYTQGRSGYPTRLVINDEFTGFVANIEETEEEDSEEPTEEHHSGTDDEAADQEAPAEEAPAEEVGDPAEIRAKVQPFEEAVDEGSKEETVEETTVEKTLNNGAVEVEVNIEISSSDWDSEEVVELINTIQSE